MKLINLAIIFVFSVVLNYTAFAVENKTNKEEIKNDKVEVIYFYTSSRCNSCFKIENYTKITVDSIFVKEAEAGTISFKMINVEAEENKHFIQDYNLYTKSVVLRVIDGDKVVKSKNLDKIWSLLNNKDSFIDYVKKNINDIKG